MRRAGAAVLAVGATITVASCVPADEALELGSVQFTLDARPSTDTGGRPYDVRDGWTVQFDRVVLGFKTMTVGKVDDPDACSFRGRGAVSDVVFDARAGLVQTFNGLRPVDCPDVGVILGPPGDATALGDGVTSADLVELASGRPAHAIVEATATRGRDAIPIALRFESDVTATHFGGCRSALPGVRVVGGERQKVEVRFVAQNLFREALSRNALIALEPFFQADFVWGNDDGIVTMDDLDEMPLSVMPIGYQLADGTRNGSFGDYVRALFRFTFTFRDDNGSCIGNEPGAAQEGAPSDGS